MNTNTNEQQEKTIFGVFSQDEVIKLHDEYKLNGNPNVSLRKIATPLLRKHYLRTWDEGTQDEKDEIQTQFINIQSFVVTTDKIKTKTIEHKKGDVIRDQNGDPLTDGTNSDGSPRYRLYQKTTLEKVEEKEEVPYFDTRRSPQSLRDIERRLRSIEVLPDYDELRKTYLKDVNYERGCELIRNLTNYYIFSEPEKFIERFGLLICNAKAKALGYQPKWPVLFSLVGKMGVGKTWLSDKVKETHDKAFGCRSGVTSYGKLLDGQFNAMMMTRGFLTLDEAQGLDKTQCEKLKTYITSQKVDIERKGIDVQTCDNLVTFFSATNESVKDVMGYQPDRRIVEFIINEKKGEIPEDDLVKWLNEIWRVMPIEHPQQDAIKEDLLKTSSAVLDENMSDVVYAIFKNGSYDDYANPKGRLNIIRLKKALKDVGNVSFVRVRDWCVDKGIISRQDDGRMNLSRRGLETFLASMGNPQSKSIDILEQLGLEG